MALYQLNRIIDQTMLKPNVTKKDLECFCDEALYYNFICVALLPNVIKEASIILKGSQVHIMAAISYPRGMVPVEIKKKEIEEQKNRFFYVHSKIPSLDKSIDGFESGEMIIIAGATGQGKTTF